MPKALTATKYILSVIENSSHPLSSSEIQPLCSQFNRATIYRTLNHLKQIQQLRIIEIGDGTLRFESTAKHHHHLICLKCKHIEDINLPTIEESHLKKLQQIYQSQSKFVFLQHSLEFFGLCQNCHPASIAPK